MLCSHVAFTGPTPIFKNHTGCRAIADFVGNLKVTQRRAETSALIAQTETQVKLSEDNLRLSRVRYEGGEGTALDVVTAQTQLAQARSNYYAARANYLNARADLEVASGR